MPYWVPFGVVLGVVGPVALMVGAAYGWVFVTSAVMVVGYYLAQWLGLALSWAGEYLVPIAGLSVMAVLLSAIPWWCAMKTKEIWNRRTKRCV